MSLEEGCLTKSREWSQQILWRASNAKSDWLLGYEEPKIYVSFCLILWVVSTIVFDRVVILSSSVYVCNQTKDAKNEESNEKLFFQQRKFKGLSNVIIHIRQRANILVQSFSTTLFAMTLFSNVSQITAYKRSWRLEKEEEETRVCYFIVPLVYQI